MSTHFAAERWEPIESSMQVVEGVPMHAKGIDRRLPKSAPLSSERRGGRLKPSGTGYMLLRPDQMPITLH